METTTTTTSIKIHWTFVVFLAVISFLFYYGCTQNAPQTTDNKYFIKKIDSLESCIQNYEQRAEQERIYRNDLYRKRDSLENIIVLYHIYLPSLEQLKRSK